MRIQLQTIGLLILSNLFMTFAWYAHLKEMKTKPLFLAIAFSWGIAFFEYVLQVPANRLGSERFNLAQLKILQEVITLSVFLPFSLLYMGEPWRWNYVGAAACILGAVYFMFWR